MTDNDNLRAKLDLRRFMLRKYGASSVLDCCQGSGVIWSILRKEFEVKQYWGVDLKPKPGRLKIDSARLLQPGITQDVIDIDTYGSPWKHWKNLLKVATRPTTAFLTIGQRVRGKVGALSKEALEAMGIKGEVRKHLPKAFHVKLARHVLPAQLGRRGIMIVEAAEALTDNRNVRYIAVRFEPESGGPELSPPTHLNNSRSNQETEHV